MGKSIKINFAFNLLNTIVGLLFPLVTFPYISRVLFADGIGKVQFFQSIINYIALFAALGIPLYAVKEIAKNKNNIEKRNKTAVEILILYSLLTIAAYLIVMLITCFVDSIRNDWSLFVLLSLHLILVAIGAEWFYQGVEDFKYITIRSFVLKLLTLVALFAFVKEKSDLMIYALLLVMAEAGNNIFNFIHLRKYINFNGDSFKKLNVGRHVRPALKIFILNLVVSIYVNLDSIMLGFIVGTTAVGYYTAATRITRTICGFSTALGTVMLPRLSSYYNSGQVEKFYEISSQGLSFIVSITIPMVLGLMVTAPLLMPIFCGDSFRPSILTLQIISPLILFIGISGLLGTKILYAQDKENIVIYSTCFGAIINFVLNIMLIPKYAQNGAAFSSVIAELLVTTSMLYLGRKYLTYNFFNKDTFQSLLFSVIAFLPVYAIHVMHLSIYVELAVDILCTILIYIICMYTFNKYYRNIINNIINKLLR